MKIEEAIKLLEEKDEFCQDEKCLVKGLLFIEKYKPITGIAAEHDVLYVSDFIEEMTEEDVLQLNRYGFHLGEEVDSWAYFT